MDNIFSHLFFAHLITPTQHSLDKLSLLAAHLGVIANGQLSKNNYLFKFCIVPG